MASVTYGETIARTVAIEVRQQAGDPPSDDRTPDWGIDRLGQQVALAKQDRPVRGREDDRHQEERSRVDGGCERLALGLLQVRRHQGGGEREQADGEEEEQVQREDLVIHGLDPADHRVVVDPDDPDREERDRVRDVARPLRSQFPRQVPRARVRHVDVKHEERDRDREHAVGEGLQAGRAHDPGFAGPAAAPVPRRGVVRRRPVAGRLAADPLEQLDDVDVRPIGRALHPDLAGAVGGDVGVERRGPSPRPPPPAVADGGELRVQEPAVAGEAAAGRRGRDDDIVGELGGELSQSGDRGRDAAPSRWGARRASPPLRRPACGSSRSRAQSIASTISSFAWRSRVLLARARRRPRSTIPWVHELASIDDGELALVASSATGSSTILLRHPGVALAVALRAPGVAQQFPRDVGRDPHRHPGPRRDGDHRLRHAHLGPSPLPLRRAEHPVDAGGQVDGRRALARGVGQARRRRPRHRRAPLRHSSELTKLPRRPRAPRSSGPSPTARDRAAGPQRRAGGALDRCPALRGQQAPTAPRARCAARLRKSLTSLPVSIPTGQARRQRAVGGAGLDAVVLVLARSAPRARGEPCGWRAISRRSTIRWRGVVVSWRLGQTGSQNPHSTQAVASSSIGGVVFRFCRCSPGSRFRITPGPSTPSGSASSLDPPHQLGRLRAPLALDERRHVHAGAVLGLQRAVVLVDDQRRRARP